MQYQNIQYPYNKYAVKKKPYFSHNKIYNIHFIFTMTVNKCPRQSKIGLFLKRFASFSLDF